VTNAKTHHRDCETCAYLSDACGVTGETRWLPTVETETGKCNWTPSREYAAQLEAETYRLRKVLGDIAAGHWDFKATAVRWAEDALKQ
jgi:hypothetical protein